MKVLIAGEQSQIITEAFIKRGHNAMSCDNAYDGAKGLPHYRGDLRDLLTEYFDLVIFHPVCRYLTNSGVRWLEYPARWDDLKLAIEFFNLRHKFNSPCVATENPIPHKYAVTGINRDGVRFADGIGVYDQCVQPWHFGDEKMKATCWWLKNLPKLNYTDIVGPPPKGFENRKSWQDVWMCSPGPERERLRSVFYSGMANAVADQWGKLMVHSNTASLKLAPMIQNVIK